MFPEDRSSCRSPPGPGDKRQQRHSVSVSSDNYSENENEPRRKSRREGNSISVHATDDDAAKLLAEPPIQAPVTNKPDDVASEDELLNELEAALQDEDKKGPKVQQQLTNIVIKR